MHQEIVTYESPERNLWLAVIERALKDYCFFFDRLMQRRMSPIYRRSDDADAVKATALFKKCVAEFERLQWFLFDNQPQPFNLVYLVLQLYDDDTGMVSNIRKVAEEQFKRQLDIMVDQKLFPVLVDHIQKNSTANQAKAAEQESKLRHKRFRLTTDI